MPKNQWHYLRFGFQLLKVLVLQVIGKHVSGLEHISWETVGIWPLLQQCSDVWALSRWKPTFLWKDQFVLVCHARLLKTYRFNSFMTKSFRKNFQGEIWICVEVIFNDPLESGVLGLKWRIMLLSRCNLNTLQSQITCFKRCVHLFVKKSQIIC